MLGFLCYIFMWIVTSCAIFKVNQCDADDGRDVCICMLLGFIWPVTIVTLCIVGLFKYIFKIVEKLG